MQAVKFWFAAALLAVSVHAAWACPTINGRYIQEERRKDGIMTRNVTLYTRHDGTSFSYTRDGNTYQEAGGAARPLMVVAGFGSLKQFATIKLSCEGSTLVQEVQPDDDPSKVWMTTFTPIGTNQLRVESNIPGGYSGIFERQE
jgi:hypothetical protein